MGHRALAYAGQFLSNKGLAQPAQVQSAVANPFESICKPLKATQSSAGFIFV